MGMFMDDGELFALIEKLPFISMPGATFGYTFSAKGRRGWLRSF
jgi:hypothetical protein